MEVAERAVTVEAVDTNLEADTNLVDRAVDTKVEVSSFLLISCHEL